MPPYQERSKRPNKPMKKIAKRDPIYIDGRPPRPMSTKAVYIPGRTRVTRPL